MSERRKGCNQYTPLLERLAGRYVVNEATGCWDWTGYSVTERSNPCLRRAACTLNKKHSFAYRMSWIAHRGPIPDGLFVCHRCDNPMCVNPEHLFLGTNSDNQRDSIAKGRNGARTHPEKFRANAIRLNMSRRGKPGPRCKSRIPHADCHKLREELASGVTARAIGERYGISHQAVKQFLKREEQRLLAQARQALANAKGGD